MSTLEQLLEMGFGENQSKRALQKTNYKGIEQAMEWLIAHSEDADINDPIEIAEGKSLGDGNSENAAPVVQSLKCDDCGKLLSTPQAAENHASRTGHENFSESTEIIKPLTEEEKAAQLVKLQDKLKNKRAETAVKDAEEKKANERMRRVKGREMADAKAKFQELEFKKIADDKRREKEEEKLARQKVKDAIARDRAERLAKKESNSEVKQSTPAPVVAAASPSVVEPKKEYTYTKLQIRLPTGTPITQTFEATESLAAVRLFALQRVQTDNPAVNNISLSTAFPRKLYIEDDMQINLKSLGLVPSAVLMVKLV